MKIKPATGEVCPHCKRKLSVKSLFQRGVRICVSCGRQFNG